MTKEELIGYCRYYKGEEKNPYDRYENLYESEFWSMERWWVDMDGAFTMDWEDYKALGGKDFPDIPNSLLSYFWRRFRKVHEYGYTMDEFYEEMEMFLSLLKRREYSCPLRYYFSITKDLIGIFFE